MAVNSKEKPRGSGGMFSFLGHGLRDLVLNKSSAEYALQTTGGSDEYWDRMVAAQYGWPGHKQSRPRSDAVTSQA
jgi:hypothetical protein